MAQLTRQIAVQTSDWPAYQLLDAGHGQKLEKIGGYTIVRSEPKAWWQPSLNKAAWDKADAFWSLENQQAWQASSKTPTEWVVPWQKLQLQIKLTTMSKHIGIFPEHDSQWRWLQTMISQANRPVQLINLFGYTGVASLVAAQAGAHVTHVDASKASIGWARENQRLSGLETAPIRWILDDALKFLKREIRRGKKYDAIVLDPPAFGRGPSGQVWKLQRDLPELLQHCAELLSDTPLLVYLTTYTADLSSLTLGNLLVDMVGDRSGTVTVGELALQPTTGSKVLPLSMYGQWSA